MVKKKKKYSYWSAKVHKSILNFSVCNFTVKDSLNVFSFLVTVMDFVIGRCKAGISWDT